ncbi:MAG: haloalkane dehalogenase [Lewinellaceae bacterium]|nr:haloalkane dehalogenase [Lewinellaceae bacterium]
MATSPSVLRTPEERFSNLPDFPFAAHYADIQGFRIHYLDEGDPQGQVVLLLHGEPSWCYLYRKMIPPLVAAGYRVVAPDLLGFGKSDKPADQSAFTHRLHVSIIYELVKQLDLQGINLFIQDWGGLVGLRMVGLDPDRFARIMAANTLLPDAGGLKGLLGPWLFRRQIKQIIKKGGVTEDSIRGPKAFLHWVVYSQTAPELNIGRIIQKGTVKELSAAEVAAYEAPFPDESYKAAARIFPMLVPSELLTNHRVWKTVLERWEKPFLTAFSDTDPITRGMEKIFHKRVPGTRNQAHFTTEQAGHFLQEDQGELLAAKMHEFIQSTTSA